MQTSSAALFKVMGVEATQKALNNSLERSALEALLCPFLRTSLISLLCDYFFQQ